MSNVPGILYIVGTPIGNLADISRRAVEVLSGVDVIAVEDTRHSRPMLRQFQIDRPLVALHDHNEREATTALLGRLHAGQSVALISDAGTPLISDPGFQLVRTTLESGVRVVPVPGPSAFLCALSAAGLPTDRFRFEGFLPRTSSARRTRLQELAAEQVTLIFHESSHRVQAALEDMAAVLGGQRLAAVARELTKKFESIQRDSLQELCAWIVADPNHRKGEFVILVAGAEAEDPAGQHESEVRRTLEILLEELPAKLSAALAARLTGGRRNEIYRLALSLKDDRGL